MEKGRSYRGKGEIDRVPSQRNLYKVRCTGGGRRWPSEVCLSRRLEVRRLDETFFSSYEKRHLLGRVYATEKCTV